MSLILSRPIKSRQNEKQKIGVNELIILFLGTVKKSFSPPELRQYLNHFSIIINDVPLSDNEANFGISNLYKEGLLSTENGYFIKINDHGLNRYKELLDTLPRDLIEELLSFSLFFNRLLEKHRKETVLAT